VACMTHGSRSLQALAHIIADRDSLPPWRGESVDS
jgi:hypothetical protein